MSRDFVILDSSGRPETRVGISVEQHCELMVHAKRLALVLLQSLQDYYEDVVFSAGELSALSNELSNLGAQLERGSAIADVLQDLICLVALARDQGKEVQVLAD